MFQLISSGPYVCGETPLWDNKDFLYWVDAANHHVFRWSQATGITEEFTPEVPVSAIRPAEEGLLYLLSKWGLSTWSPEEGRKNGRIHKSVDFLDSNRTLRFNDGWPTGNGGFVAGAFNEADLYAGDGILMYINMNGESSLLDNNLHVPNGISISQDNTTIYMSEMYKNRILSYSVSGDFRQTDTAEVFAEIPETEGMPDGLTVDEAGMLWVAHWQGSRISRYNPDGRKINSIVTPFTTPTCICFDAKGGLFVTTATLDLSPEVISSMDNPGGVFFLDSSDYS